MSKLIILIGGTPTAGKSTLAGLLSERLKLPWISTDQTRDIMKVIANKDENPELFNDADYDAEAFLTKFSPEEIADMEFKQGIAAWPGNKHLIEKDYTWPKGFIMEGVGIIPELVATLETNNDIRPIFIVDESEERMRDVVFNRGLWDAAHTYSDDLKEIEVKWATIFSKSLEESARKHNYPVVKIEKNTDKDVKAVMEALKL